MRPAFDGGGAVAGPCPAHTAVRDAPPLLAGSQFRHSSLIVGLVLTRPPRSGRAGHTKCRGLGSRPRLCDWE